jgi:hypothetical protein
MGHSPYGTLSNTGLSWEVIGFRQEGNMENIDWMTVLPGGLAIFIFLGGMLMMFTNIWTTKGK